MAKKPVPKKPVAKPKATKPPVKANATKPQRSAAVDPLDETPSVPQVFVGIWKGVQGRTAIVYKRDERTVWTVMLSNNGGQRVLVKWSLENFVANMRPARLPTGEIGKVYPLERALRTYLQPGAVYEDAAYRVLVLLHRGEDPNKEVSVADLLDMTPSDIRPRVAQRRTYADKAARRLKRKQRLQGMTPAALTAYRQGRNEKRRLRRANARKARQK